MDREFIVQLGLCGKAEWPSSVSSDSDAASSENDPLLLEDAVAYAIKEHYEAHLFETCRWCVDDAAMPTSMYGIEF